MNTSLESDESKKRALIAIRTLKQKLEQLERRQNEPIAVVGMGCRLPGDISTPAEFWKLLRAGENAVSRVSEHAWNVDSFAGPLPNVTDNPYLKFKGHLSGIDQFDAPFFRISPREAEAMDPQQRLLLEVAWEALENAGFVPEQLVESNTGVFVGLSTLDYAQLGGAVTSYAATGNSLSTAAGRISYTLGFRGPCVPVDTACSSSLVAVTLAVQQLRSGATDLALAGGVNLLLSPMGQLAMGELGALSKTGRCRAFDAAADGIVRSEGCGMLVLKRLSDAERDSDHVHAVIRAARINHDGRSNGLTAPSGGSQQEVIRAALKEAGLAPADIDYIEAHGTGTPLGDPIELGALGAVFSGDRAPDQPLGVGSLKTNLGHMEAASGVGGLLKVVLALRHELLPKTLHFEEPNPHIEWDEIPISVVDRERPWPRGARPRRAGVSAFGFGGTNAHVIVEEAPQAEPASPTSRGPKLLLISASSGTTLHRQAARYADFIESGSESLLEICHTAARHRSHFDHRRAFVADARGLLVDQLRAVPSQTAPNDLTRHKLAFLFRAGEPATSGDTEALLEDYPTYTEAGTRFDEACQAVLFEEPASTLSALRQGFALTALFSSWGVRPKFVFGPGAAEYLAAHAAGVLSLEHALLLVAARRQALRTLGERAAWAVRAPESTVLRLTETLETSELALSHGPELHIVTSTEVAADAAAAVFRQHTVEVQRLPSAHDAPSARLSEAARSEFKRALQGVGFERPRMHVVSSSTGHVLRPEELSDPEYWLRQLTSPARVDRVFSTLQRHGALLQLELATRPTLVQRARALLGGSVVATACGSGTSNGAAPLLAALATLYEQNAEVDWSKVFVGRGRRVELPTYAFDKQRYWVTSQTRARESKRDLVHALLGYRVNVAGLAAVFENQLEAMPVGQLRVAVVESARAAACLLFDTSSASVSDIEFEPDFAGVEGGTWQLVVSELTQAQATFCVSVSAPQAPDTFLPLARGLLRRAPEREFDRAEAGRLGGGHLRHGVLELTTAAGAAENQLLLRPELLDRVLAFAASLESSLTSDAQLTLNGVGALVCGSTAECPVRAEVWLVEVIGSELRVDLELTNAHGTLVASLRGVRLAAQRALALSPEDKNDNALAETAYSVGFTAGRLDTLSPRPTVRRAPGADEVEVRVRATGLNFADALNALGLHPGGERPLGSDCAGVIERLGSGVDQLSVGDEVVACAPGALASHVTVHASLVVRRPPDLSATQAATLPTAFLTATHALKNLARLQPGQRVLIHAAAGGVGMAAVQVARLAGAQVFATASPAKWEALRALGVEHTMNSRTLEFVDEVRAITQGRGVDVVLNSLSGDTIPAGLGLLASGGHFLELGKRDAWSVDRVRSEFPDVQYHPIDLSQLDRAEVANALHEIVASVATNTLRPLPESVFPLERVADAFQHLARAKHVGKVVVLHPERWQAAASCPALDANFDGAPPTPEPSLVTELRGMTVAQARRRLSEVVREAVADILGFGDKSAVGLETGFADLGMDSIMAVELRGQLETRVGKRISATVAFDYPTVAGLAQHLLELLEIGQTSTALVSERRRTAHSDKIAIVGAACRFPRGVSSLEEYWELLRDGVHAVTEVPRERWNADVFYDPDPEKPAKTYSRWGAYLDDIKGFDAGFFGISPREAEAMDPQQRILLEVAWEAFENANLPLPSLRDGRTGVFVGVGENEYRFLTTDVSNPYLIAGNMAAVVAGRLSHSLGLGGPALAVQTACSSALVALHLAVQSLRSGESNVAIAGGIGVILTVYSHIGRAKLKALAADGRCKTFDHAADGYVPGEGCGLVVLKRLADAEQAGDHILGVIRGSAVNHDGASSGLTVPNGPAQQFVIAEALRDAALEPVQVDYVETHGTGTPLGDPIEVQALDAVYSKGRSKERPLLIGSVKTNLGHLEPAAGIASLLKVVLALGHREIPRHLHLTHPNELIPWDQLALSVVLAHQEWPATAGAPRVAGVSAFGMSGTNAHVLVEEPPAPRPQRAEHQKDQHLLVLSARSERALGALASRYAAQLERGVDALADVCHTAGVRRTPFRHRLALVARDNLEMVTALRAYVKGTRSPAWCKAYATDDPQPVAFLFTGQGEQHVGMGAELYECEPAFRAAIDRCDKVISSLLGESVLPIMFVDDPEAKLKRTRFTQPALFALGYALSELWKSWGVVPDVVMGHSFGEYVAACVAGVFTPEAAIKILVFRGDLADAQVQVGAMATVPLPAEQVEVHLEGFRHEVSIAAYNGADHVVISGTPQGVQAACAHIEQAAEVRAWPLQVSHAFHSPMLDPVLDEFEAFVAKIPMSSPRLPIVSNLTGQQVGDEVCTPAYWRRHMREPVQFVSGVHALFAAGARCFVEIGPQPTLLSMASGILDDTALSWLPSLRKGQDASRQMLCSLGQLWTRGNAVDLAASLAPFSARTTQLPTYPFEHKEYWIDDQQFLKILAAQSYDNTSKYFHELTWQLLDEPSPGEAPRGPFLILADRLGVAEALSTALEQRGVEHRLLYQDSADVPGALGPEHGDREVVCLWGLDQHIDDTTTALEAWQVATTLCETVSRLVRHYAREQTKPRLWLVTRAVHPIGSGAVALSHSALWGIGRVLSLEHPDLWGGIVDLPPLRSADEIELLLSSLANQSDEDQFAIRDGQLRVARLAERPVAVEPVAPSFDRERSYLVTGGVGAIGLHVAGWLVEHGARQIVLTSRRGLPDRAIWDEVQAPEVRRRITAIQNLEARGANVYVHAVDVADEPGMQQVFANLPSALAGVFHIAGIAALAPLGQLDRATIESYLLPKVRGTWILHRLTRQLPLDHFVVFSSVAAMWGGYAQGPYAASNHFMDSVIHHRRQLGLAGQSINWAEWAEGGLGSPEAIEYLRRIGVLTMTTPAALSGLARALSHGAAQITVGNIEWSTFKPVYSAHRRRRLFDLIVESESAAPEPTSEGAQQQPGWFLSSWDRPTAELTQALHDLVRSETARVLRLASSNDLDLDASFIQMGMDSLMAVELRNSLTRALGVNLPTTVVMRNPTVNDLTRVLDDSCACLLAETSGPTRKPDESRAATQQSKNYEEIEI